MTDYASLIERAAKAIYFAGDGNIWAEDFHDQIWAGSQGLRDEDYEIDGGDEYDDVLVRGRNWYRAQASAALLAALDPEDDELWDEIGCEIGGGSGDEAQAVEAAFYVRLVVRELRKRIGQGQVRASLSDTEREDGK